MLCSAAMEPLIRTLTLRGFRSFEAETIDFDNPTFLVGRNGTGKSTLVDAFRLLGEAMGSPLAARINSRGGLPELLHRRPGTSAPIEHLGIGVGFGSINGVVERAQYAFQVRKLAYGGFTVDRERCQVQGEESTWFDRQGGQTMPGLLGMLPAPHTEPDSLLLPIAGGLPSFAPLVRILSAIRAYTIDPAHLRRTYPPESGLSLSSDGKNVASVIRELQQRSPDDLEAVCEFLSAAMPYPLRAQPVQQGPGLGLEFHQGRQDSVVFDSTSMSDGTLRMLGLILIAFQHQVPSVVLIEEPEASVHPGALGVILDLLQVLADKVQVIVTTHSPELLNAKWIEDRHLRLVSWEDGRSRVRHPSSGVRKVIQENLAGVGELLRSDALDADPEPATAAADLFQSLA
jgi:predicted ATPase